MPQEKNYDFLKRMREVHKPNRRDQQAKPAADEIEIDNSWKLVIPAGAGKLLRRAASDFQDYLFTSMNVSVPILEIEGPGRHEKSILLFRTLDISRSGKFQGSIDMPGIFFRFSLAEKMTQILLQPPGVVNPQQRVAG